MKLWSITTTIRNPDRLTGVIEICNEFDGKFYSKKSS